MNSTRSAFAIPLPSLAALGVLSALAIAPPLRAETPPAAGHAAPVAAAQAQTGHALRDLWLGHVFWVRNVVAAAVAANTAAAAAAEREVVANAKAIAAAIEPFYGKDAAARLFALLGGHYGAVRQYLDAHLARSAAGEEAAIQALTANADEIARFLAAANPNLSYATLTGMLAAHGGHHIQQIRQLGGGQFADEAQTWEAMKQHMYALADALTVALARQFPAHFAAAGHG